MLHDYPYCDGGLVAKLSLTLATPRTIVHQAPLSMEFPRQEYWSGLPFPSPEDLPNSRIKPESPALAGGFFTTAPPGKPPSCIQNINYLLHMCVENCLSQFLTFPLPLFSLVIQKALTFIQSTLSFFFS